jgi:hypothetical protein
VEVKEIVAGPTKPAREAEERSKKDTENRGHEAQRKAVAGVY